jgi:uncharacterized membrane protein
METEKTEMENYEIQLEQLAQDVKYCRRRLIENSLFLILISFIYYQIIDNNIRYNSFGTGLDYFLLVFYCIFLILSIMALRVAHYNYSCAQRLLYCFTEDPEVIEEAFRKFLEDEKEKE